jgi:hypothetical protein
MICSMDENQENIALSNDHEIAKQKGQLKVSDSSVEETLKDEITQLKLLNTKYLLELSFHAKSNELAAEQEQNEYNAELLQKLEQLEDEQKVLLDDKVNMVALSDFRIKKMKSDLKKSSKTIEGLTTKCSELERSESDGKRKYEEIVFELADAESKRRKAKDDFKLALTRNLDTIKSRDKQIETLLAGNSEQKLQLDKCNEEITWLLTKRSQATRSNGASSKLASDALQDLLCECIES